MSAIVVSEDPLKLRVHVSVTQEDINTGVRADCQECAVALAIDREFRGSKKYRFSSLVETRARVMAVSLQGSWMLTAYTSPFVEDFIRSFDRADPLHRSQFSPFEFDLEFA